MEDNAVELDDKSTEKTITQFHLEMQSLAALAVTQLKHAKENQERDASELQAKFSKATEGLKGGTLNPLEFAKHVNTAIDSTNDLTNFSSFPHEEMLAKILFISIFSSFDAYLNHLLRNLYARRPKLLLSLESKDVLFSDVLTRSKQEIVDGLIDAELNSLLRDSYMKMFDRLCKRFSIKTLTAFGNWPAFVEFSQRRNVITHCDGIASDQYVRNCRSAGLTVAAKVGHKLDVSREYLMRAIEVVTEVGIKLGQVLWRSSGDTSISAADAHLAETLFGLLKREQWTLALRMGEFGQDLAKRGYKKPRNERSQKVIIINHAQAAKWSGDHAASMRIVDEFDWSGSAYEFRLAVACLKEEWDNAADLMRKLGISDAVPVHGYVGWPIFREFRTKPQFSEKFKSIFGVEFAVEIEKAGEEAAEAGPAVGRKPERADDAC